MLKLLVFFLGIMFFTTYFFLDKDYSHSEEFRLNGRKKVPVITDNGAYANNQEHYRSTPMENRNKDLLSKKTNGPINDKTNSLPLKSQDVNFILDADEAVYTFNNNKGQNTGSEINADDASYVFDNNEEKNVGITTDANVPTSFYDNSKSQDTGDILNASKENNTYKQGPGQNIGPILNADM